MALQGKFVVNNAHYSPLSILVLVHLWPFLAIRHTATEAAVPWSLITAITRGVLLDC